MALRQIEDPALLEALTDALFYAETHAIQLLLKALEQFDDPRKIPAPLRLERRTLTVVALFRPPSGRVRATGDARNRAMSSGEIS